MSGPDRAVFDRHWKKLKKAARRAGTFGKEYVWQEIASGRSILISNKDSALVFTARAVPDGRLCLYAWLTAGTLDGTISLLREAEEWGRAHGCTLSAMDCRLGYSKALPDYRLTSVTLSKEL